MKGVPFSIDGIWKGYLFVKNHGIWKGKGLDLGTEPPCINLCWVPLPPGIIYELTIDLLSELIAQVVRALHCKATEVMAWNRVSTLTFSGFFLNCLTSRWSYPFQDHTFHCLHSSPVPLIASWENVPAICIPSIHNRVALDWQNVTRLDLKIYAKVTTLSQKRELQAFSETTRPIEFSKLLWSNWVLCCCDSRLNTDSSSGGYRVRHWIT